LLIFIAIKPNSLLKLMEVNTSKTHTKVIMNALNIFNLIFFEVIRFSNHDVDNNFDGVCTEIVHTVNAKLGSDIYQ